MGRRKENKDQFEADVAALQTLWGMFVHAFKTLDDFGLALSSEDMDLEEFVERSKLAITEGREVETLTAAYIEGFKLPRPNNKGDFKHMNFYRAVPRCLQRLLGVLTVYRTAFRLIGEDTEDSRMLAEKAWSLIKGSKFVEANLFFLRDLPAVRTIDMISVIDADTALDRQMESIRELGLEMAIALGMRDE